MPSFTIGSVDPASASLLDYTVFKAISGGGAGYQWQREYSFDATYGVESFTPKPLATLVDRLVADRTGQSPDGLGLQAHLNKGVVQKKTAAPFHAYACSLANTTQESFHGCFCAAP